MEAFSPGIIDVSNTQVHQICGRMGITHYEGLVNLDRKGDRQIIYTTVLIMVYECKIIEMPLIKETYGGDIVPIIVRMIVPYQKTVYHVMSRAALN